MGGIFPEKHQHRWANDLLIEFDSINWPIMYKNDYHCTLDTKLQSFRIKLNLQAMVSISKLFELCLIENDQCIYCKNF